MVKENNKNTLRGDGKYVNDLRLFLYGSFDPELDNISKETWDAYKPKIDSKFGKIFIFGTGGDLENNYKNLFFNGH